MHRCQLVPRSLGEKANLLILRLNLSACWEYLAAGIPPHKQFGQDQTTFAFLQLTVSPSTVSAGFISSSTFTTSSTTVLGHEILSFGGGVQNHHCQGLSHNLLTLENGSVHLGSQGRDGKASVGSAGLEQSGLCPHHNTGIYQLA